MATGGHRASSVKEGGESPELCCMSEWVQDGSTAAPESMKDEQCLPCRVSVMGLYSLGEEAPSTRHLQGFRGKKKKENWVCTGALGLWSSLPAHSILSWRPRGLVSPGRC